MGQSTAQYVWAQVKNDPHTAPHPPHICTQLLGGLFATHWSMHVQFLSPRQEMDWAQQLLLTHSVHLSS